MLSTRFNLEEDCETGTGKLPGEAVALGTMKEMATSSYPGCSAQVEHLGRFMEHPLPCAS